MDTGRLINKLSNCLRRRSAETQKRIHISGTKGQILNYILIESQKRPLVQRDVELEFGLRPSTATEMLQALQAADLIRREPDPADARRKCIVCTEKAEAFRPACLQEITETEAMLLRGISPEERDTFMRIGLKMLSNFEKTINHYRRAGCPAASMETNVKFSRGRNVNNLDNDTLLGKAPIPRAVAAMAIPSVISSLVTVVYNLADTFFVGQTGDALQVAAVSLTNPIFILLMAFANMFGMGGSAIISVALGENNHQSVKKISSFISWASLVVGAAFASVLLCFTAPILHLFGADASTFEFARGYTVYIAFGAPFIIWSAAASFVVRAEGASKEAMIGSMIGTIANIVLDPVFVSGLGQGAAGAAIATTIGNMLAALYYLWYFLKKSRRFSLAPKDALCGTHIAVRVCSAGFPTAIFSALMCVSTIVLNLILVAYGNAPVAAIGIVFKANMFITFLQMGLANGVQPIFGYSYGAGDIKRFADTERFTKLCCFVVGLAATALYFFLREPIIGLFVMTAALLHTACRC